MVTKSKFQNITEYDPHQLFETVTRYDALFAGWEKVSFNAGAAGGDGMTVGLFEARAQNRISHLSHSLRNGRYRPGPIRQVGIPKKSGGTRVLSIPCVRDRVAQSAAANALMALLEPEFEDTSFGYRPGRSVAQAVSRVAAHRRDGYRWVVDADIRAYFDSVPHDPLLTLLEKHVPDLRFVDLIALWLEHAAPEGMGLPQGMPISPVLANLYLDGIDEQIARRGVRLVRFADDFVLLCKDEAAAGDAVARVGGLLADHGLELHPDKTRIVPFDQGFRFLGHVFVRSMVWKEIGDDETPQEDDVERAHEAMRVLAARDGMDDGESAEQSDEAPGRYAARVRTLYVLEVGRELTVRNGQFAVVDGEAEILRLPPARINRIEIGTGAKIATEALDLAAAWDVPLWRVDGHGNALGQYRAANAPGNAALALAQAGAVLDEARRLAFARTFVEARIFNQRALIRRLSRKDKNAEVEQVAVKLGRTYRKLRRKDLTVQSAMGHEGEAAALYWPGLARFIAPQWAFGGYRARRGNTDPVNIMFDVMANMLARDVANAVDRAGLHPGFGMLHQARDDHDALVYDLMEEFRGPVAEACVMTAIGRGALRPTHFVRDDNSWRATREGWRAMIRAYEVWVSRPIADPQGADKTLWRGLFERQARRFAQAVETGEAYQPYQMDY